MGERLPTRYLVGLALLIAASASSLSRAFVGSSWIIPVAVSVAASIGLLQVFRTIRLGTPWRQLALSAAGLWFASEMIAGGTRFGFPRLGVVAGELAEAGRRLREIPFPIVPDDGTIALAVAFVWVAVLVSEPSLHRGTPIMASLPWFAVFEFTAAAARDGETLRHSAVFLGGFGAFLYLTHTRHSWSRSHAPAAAAITSVGVLAAMLLPAYTPGYGSPSLLTFNRLSGGDGVSLSPLVQIQPRLTDRREVALFDVEIGSTPPPDAPLYWRLYSLDEFNGSVWTTAEDAPRTQPPSPGYVLAQRVNVLNLRGRGLPAALDVRAVTGISAVVDRRRAVVQSLAPLERGMSYQAVSVLPNVSARDLSARSVASIGGRFTSTNGVSREVQSIARQITRGKVSDYDRVIALVNHLRGFTYDESVRPGHSSDQILHFLTKSKAGYCEQFAGTMAVLARSIGIPSRVGVGFLPGDPRNGKLLVTTEHAHAWTEIYFQGLGWIPFEPTPRGLAGAPLYQVADLAPSNLEEQIDPEAPVEPAAPTEPEPAATEGPQQVPASPNGSGRPAGDWWRLITGLMTALAIPAGLALAKRLRVEFRYRRASSSGALAAAAFSDVAERASDLGFARRPDQTPAEFLTEIERELKLRSEDVRTVLAVYHVAAFADWGPQDEEATEARASASSLVKQIWRAAGWRGRVALILSVRSLLPARTR